MSAAIRQSILYSQNFLKDSHLVASLLDQSALKGGDRVYEIGPGRGIITEQLVLRYKRIVAIEKDPHLSDLLQQKFARQPNVTIHTGDFLSYNLPRKPYQVFANIPFNITTAIVGKLTTADYPPEDAYLVMQKEAAEMFLGQPRESLRSILLKPWFEPGIVHHFQRRDFHPIPRVDVVMLRLRKRGPPLVSNANRQCFRDFVVYIFTTWQPAPGSPLNSLFSRQQRASLRRELGFDLERVPTSISFEQWLRLFECFTAGENKRAMQIISGSEQHLIRQQSRLQKIHRTRS